MLATSATQPSESGGTWKEVTRLASALAAALRSVVSTADRDSPAASACLGYAGIVDEIVRLARDGGQGPIGASVCHLALTTRQQLVTFGKLLRDKRSRAGLSRVALGRMAGLSDATVKFVEVAKHPPSRQTLIKLVKVQELGLKWSETPGASPKNAPADADDTTLGAALYRFDPRVAVSLVRDAFLLLDEMQASLTLVEVTRDGCRRACALCGMRSESWASDADDAAKLPIHHAAPCVARLTALIGRQHPVIAEVAREERLAPRTEIAIQVAVNRRAARVERFLGCRSIGEVAAQLARAAALPRDEVCKGASALWLWALALGPCPIEPRGDVFSEKRASQIAYEPTTSAEGARLKGITQAAAWLVCASAQSPCDSDAFATNAAGQASRRSG